VLTWLRKQPVLKRITIVVLTASKRIGDVERAYDCGANFFLVKPGSIEDLIIMIGTLRDWLLLNRFPPLNESGKR